MKALLAQWFLLVAFLACQAVGDERALPEKVQYYLDKTEKIAETPLLGDKDGAMLRIQFAPFTQPLDMGEMGALTSIEVLQVVDERNLRANISWQQPVKYKVDGPNGKEFFRLDQVAEENVWIEGISTNGMVDGKSYHPPTFTVFEIAGSKKYTNVIGGSNSVYHLRAVDLTEYSGHFANASKHRVERARAVLAEQKARAAEMLAEQTAKADATREKRWWRTWTDSSGKFKLHARFVGLKPGGVVQLRKEDGTEVELKGFQLSRSDLEWIRNTGRSLVDEP